MLTAQSSLVITVCTSLCLIILISVLQLLLSCSWHSHSVPIWYFIMTAISKWITWQSSSVRWCGKGSSRYSHFSNVTPVLGPSIQAYLLPKDERRSGVMSSAPHFSWAWAWGTSLVPRGEQKLAGHSWEGFTSSQQWEPVWLVDAGCDTY